MKTTEAPVTVSTSTIPVEKTSKRKRKPRNKPNIPIQEEEHINNIDEPKEDNEEKLIDPVIENNEEDEDDFDSTKISVQFGIKLKSFSSPLLVR